MSSREMKLGDVVKQLHVYTSTPSVLVGGALVNGVVVGGRTGLPFSSHSGVT